jgi:hypothetical protein
MANLISSGILATLIKSQLLYQLSYRPILEREKLYVG